ncbi:hypothetical protein [Nocardia sp. alder85J]|uniref:hypothetical protein n=1 Tax=Nocardia sp. alder85J TaxID=2862949 RepID=UPI001CD57B3E|nr:hypothetical protein [Nocardia sp. alder85J]MCX4096664.1 hypothetical protein [Nocardia sp. alder85J]
MTHPLIVPVQIDTYLVNTVASEREEGYGQWTLDFTDPANLAVPPEPYPDPHLDDRPAVGAHVRWSLPHALRAHHQDTDTFPLVPNRWLVVRSSRPANAAPAFAAWVVESDSLVDPDIVENSPDRDAWRNYPWQGNHSPYPFTVPAPDEYYIRGDLKEGAIGRAFDTDAWAEKQTTDLFLTAIGPGLPDFCGFLPYHRGVFAFYDDLAGVDRATLDYLVVGWYSDPTADILATPGRRSAPETAALLDALGWTPGRLETDPVSVYAGTALRLPWDRTNRDYPQGKLPESADRAYLAVGHSTAEAQTADLHSDRDEVAVGRLLHAFLTDGLETLDTAPDQFDDRVHSSWFIPYDIGHAWTIADAPGSETAATEDELEKERAWLAELNERQYRYNLLARNEIGLQNRVYDLWRLGRMPVAYGGAGRPADFDPATTINELAVGLLRIQDEMRGLRTGTDAIPSGDSAAEFEASAFEYARARGLDPTCADPAGIHRRLKAVPLPPFYTPYDPVVVLGGVNAEQEPYPEVLPCRSDDQLVAAIRIGDSMQPPPEPPPLPGWSAGLPDHVRGCFSGLFREFTLLSRAAATDDDLVEDLGTLVDGVSAAFHDAARQPTGPGHFTGLWDQPWSPVYLLWELDYYPVPADATDGYHWAFDAGEGRYRLTRTGAPQPIPAWKFVGRSALTDLPQQLVHGAVERHLRRYRDAPVEELADRLGVGEISQMLDGFHRSLDQRMPGMGVQPNENDPSESHLCEMLTGYDHPDAGFPAPDPDVMAPTAKIRFFPACAGQFVVTFAGVVDSMGRTFTYIDAGIGGELSPAQRLPWVAGTLTPSAENDHPITVGEKWTNPGCYVQLAPRLTAPTRLRFDWVPVNTSAAVPGAVIDDPPVVATASAPAPTPALGWLLVNHLSGTLLVHDEHGRGIVEARKGIGTDGNTEGPAVDWATLPYYPHRDDPTDPDGDFARLCPELFGFLTGLRDGGTDAFDALMRRIDDSAGTAAAPGNDGTMVAPLIGMPVALLRARLTLESYTLPGTDPSWGSDSAPYPVLDFRTPDYLKRQWRWNIRLGGRQSNDDGVVVTTDGLIGYFTHRTDGPDGPVLPDADTDYTVFRTADGGDSGYARRITARDLALPVNLAPMPENPHANGDDPVTPVVAYVTMLAHPWAEINAVTDVVPAVSVRLPDEAVRTPLSRLQIACRVGPILAGTRPAPTGRPDPDTGTSTTQTAVVMPRPDSWTGVWDWSEPSPWNHYPITAPDVVAHLDQPNSVARTGYLTLATTLDQVTSPTRDRAETTNAAQIPLDAATRPRQEKSQ